MLLQPEIMKILIRSLKAMDDIDKINCLTLRDATNFVSKGYLCRPEEIGMIMELHLGVVSFYYIFNTVLVFSKVFDTATGPDDARSRMLAYASM